MSGLGKSTVFVGSTGDPRIDGLLYNQGWGDATLTYSTPTSPSDYGVSYGADEHLGLQQPTAALIAAQQLYLDTQYGNAANDGFALEGFTEVAVAQTAQFEATLRVALTDRDPYGFGTAWGYFPSTVAAAGDVWLSDAQFDYSTPVTGDYANLTLLHELGHTLGLEHAHVSTIYGTVPRPYDAMEYTVMTYRSHTGASPTQYSNESYGYAQSFMMQDIAALQHIYGADFTTNSGDTVYSWSPGSGDTLVDGVVALSPGANRIFATIWDGGGTDTYDLSAYASPTSIDLKPGGASEFHTTQLAYLGSKEHASGNIYNALLFQDDPRSMIENAIGGGKRDLVFGNDADNRLEGRNGRDQLYGDDGDDVILGQVGRDTLNGGRGKDIVKGGDGEDELWGSGGRDILNGGRHDDVLLGGNSKDILKGGNGKDILRGQTGDDLLIGGKGADELTGGRGADVFAFIKTAHSPNKAGRDLIHDFETALDKIDISTLSATAFTFVGLAAFLGDSPSVRFEHHVHKTRVFADATGDAMADLSFDFASTLTLTADDFIL